jgi:D-sedoheptulose 7-phosphate isomerase
MTAIQSSLNPAAPEDSHFLRSLNHATQVLHSIRALEDSLCQAARTCCESLRRGAKILTCGNGGSACEAQHLVAELMGHYKSDRMAFPAVAMSADCVLLTCIGNDYSFDDTFARQLEALANPGDTLVVFSTSGDSPNVVRALSVARKKQITSIAFLGRAGGQAKALSDCALVVQDSDTARIQEAHQFLLHMLMDFIEREPENG